MLMQDTRWTDTSSVGVPGVRTTSRTSGHLERSTWNKWQHLTEMTAVNEGTAERHQEDAKHAGAEKEKRWEAQGNMDRPQQHEGGYESSKNIRLQRTWHTIDAKCRCINPWRPSCEVR